MTATLVDMPPHWVRDYIGKPYADHGRGPESFDCYGLVLAVLKKMGINAPDYGSQYKHSEDDESVSKCIIGVSRGWTSVRLDQVNPGDILVLRVAGIPIHIAVVISKGLMLHTLRGRNSVVESYTSKAWQGRIQEVLRWTA